MVRHPFPPRRGRIRPLPGSVCLPPLLGTIGGVGMWSVPVVLPAVQADFGVARGDASLPFTLSMIGFALGGVVMGRLSDRFGVMLRSRGRARARPRLRGCRALRPISWPFALAHVLIGLGASAILRPADEPTCRNGSRGGAASRWALRLCGNYLAGTLWPPLLQHFIATEGWRATQIGIGVFCAVTMLPLSCALRRRAPMHRRRRQARRRSLGRSALAEHALVCCASPGSPAAWRCRCRRSTSSPIAATSVTASARGAEMLSLMLGFGIVSRIAWGSSPIASAAWRRCCRLGAAGRCAVLLPAVRRPRRRST